MKKRLLAMLLALMLVVGLLPVGVLAAGSYKVVIQAVVRDENGDWVSTNALPSKNFRGTTSAGSSGGDGQWQWTPDGGGYVLTATLDSNANAWGELKAPGYLWNYDEEELTLVGIGKNSSSTEVAYGVPEYDWQWESESFYLAPSAGFTDWRTYIFEQVSTEPEPNPGINGFDKNRVLNVENIPEDIELNIDDVTINYDDHVIIPNGGSVTLLYKLTVTGDDGANFTITDEGATLVGSNCGAAQSEDRTITGTIPSGGEALIYVIKEFSSSDIKDGHLVNSATIQPGEDSELGDGVGTATDSTDASMEDPDPDPDPGDELKGTDVRVQVYVDGTAVKDPYTYVELERVSAESDSTGWKVALDSETGVITCDFDYEVGGYDCVDIGVALTTTALTGYDLQGVESYQSYGTSGTRNVTATSYGISYTIDNVTRSNDEQVDVKIYLRHTYIINYTLEGEAYSGSDSNLIANKDVEVSTSESGYPAKDNSDWMSWANPSLSNTIVLLPLPTGVENVDGWFDIHNDKHEAEKTYTVDSADAQYGIITLNATSTHTDPEPETYSVKVYAIKDMVRTTDVQIGSGTAQKGDNVLEVIKGLDINYAPAGFEKYERADDLYRNDGLYAFNEDSTINGYTNVFVNYTGRMFPVVVYAEVNGVMEEEPIWRGSAKYGASTVEYLDSMKDEMPLTRDGYELEDGWFNYDHPGQQLSAETKINGWTNVYVKFTGKPQTVRVMIYRNGDTTNPYATIDVPGYKTGDTIYTDDFNIDDYYTKDKFATDFVFDGWFDDGRWNDYKGAGCPEDGFTTVDEIYVNGWKNVIAMVWDEFPVYYNIVDENGTVVEEKIYTDTITERDLEDYTFYDASRTGYTFDGWYQDEKDVGDASKLLTGLNKAKKWELYGRYDPIPYNLVIYAAIDKDKDNAVEIYSGMVDYGTPLVEYLESLTLETDVFPGYSPEDGKWYKYDSLAWTFGESDTVAGWTNVLLNYVPNVYTLYYHGNGGVTGSGAVQSTSNFKYGSEATIKNNPFTYDGYVFEGWARSADGEVVYTGSEEVPFTEENFPGLLENGKFEFYAVWAEDSKDVTVKFIDENTSEQVGDDHTLSVALDAYNVNSSQLNSEWIPDGYELARVGDFVIEDGVVNVPVRKIAYPIQVSFVDENLTPIVEQQTVNVGGAATPPTEDDGREIVGWIEQTSGSVYTGSYDYAALAELVTANDAWNDYYSEGYLTFAAVYERIITVKIVDKDTGEEFADTYSMSVDADAIHVNTSAINPEWIPENYELADVGDLPIVDELLTVYVRKVTVEPDPYYIINIRFVDSDGTTSLGGGDVISTSPDAAYPSVPSPVAPQGMEFVGWKVWLGNEPMYEGKFTYNALKALREELDGEITWVDGRTWITFQAVYEDVTVEPDPDITDFSKTLLTDRDAYKFFDIAYPEFYHGDVVVDEGEGVTLIYRIVVEGTPGTAYTISDPGARLISNGSWTGTIDADGRVSILVAKTFSWRDVRNAGDTLDNTASVSVDGETVKTDTERVPVDIDWDINVPDIDDDDDDDVAEPDDEYIPNWLNTTDHYSYIVGYEDGTIRPGNNITRAEVATIFFRLLSEGSSERWYSASNSFSDVAADSWYNVPVSTLSNMGIIDGYEDGTFKPNAPITRAEFTAIATRFFDYTAEYEGAFNDVTYSDWYADCVQAAVDMGLVNGYADGGFHPTAYITRAESCAIVNRVLNRVPHEDYLLDEDEMITWPDNSYGAWYYADMQEATNSHDYDWIRVSGEVVEEWTDKLAEPNW